MHGINNLEAIRKGQELAMGKIHLISIFEQTRTMAKFVLEHSCGTANKKLLLEQMLELNAIATYFRDIENLAIELKERLGIGGEGVHDELVVVVPNQGDFYRYFSTEREDVYGKLGIKYTIFEEFIKENESLYNEIRELVQAHEAYLLLLKYSQLIKTGRGAEELHKFSDSEELPYICNLIWIRLNPLLAEADEKMRTLGLEGLDLS